MDTEQDASHNLALAKRDSGRIDEALAYFCRGESVAEILDHDHRSNGRDPSFYGNIGRCLALQGKSRTALKLYAKSFDSLRSGRVSENSQINLGYAADWIAEELSKTEDHDGARLFYEFAIGIWGTRSPKKAEEIEAKLNALSRLERPERSDNAIARRCDDWVDKSL